MHTNDPDLVFDAATVLSPLLAELIVELVKAGSLSDSQAAKILLRAESFIDALQFQKDEQDSFQGHQARLILHRHAVDEVSEHVQRRLSLKPRVSALRFRRRKLADAVRLKASKRL